MSYGLNIRAATKAEAKEKARKEFTNIVEFQPSHAADKHAALHAIYGFVDLLDDDEVSDITINAYGSLSWLEEGRFSAANLNVTVQLAERAAAPVEASEPA